MENSVVQKPSRLRTAIPQVLAVSAKNLILFNMGLCFGFPTIVVPAVQNSPEEPSLNDEQTSWFGSAGMIFAPVGSVLSGIVLERLGRKVSLLVVNLPFLLSWVLFYFVNTPTGLLVTSLITGLAMGLVEAPILTYVAEVSQPQLRGMLTSLSEVCSYVGVFCMYLVGTMLDWRTTAACSAAVPIICIVAISQVPESPAWLMSRGRTKEAERSLCWLRGWVEPSVVQEELLELERYYQKPEDIRKQGVVNEGFVCNPGSQDDVRFFPEQVRTSPTVVSLGNSQKYGNLMISLKAMLKPETVRPLIMITVMSFLEHWSGITGTRPFMVQVFNEFGMPIDGHWTTVAISAISIGGMLLCLVLVSRCGKRPLLFLSIAGVVVCCTLLGTYAYLALPDGNKGNNWIPLALVITLFLFHTLALTPIPWMLLSEIFPFRTRSLATGIAAALNYAFVFSASKTFLGLKEKLGLHGVYWLYAAVTALGSVYLSFEFKETEGKSLQEIEDYYKKKRALFEKSRAIVSANVMHIKTTCSENTQECHVQEENPRTQPDVEVSAVVLLHLSIEEGQQREGSTNPSFEENAKASSSALETKRPPEVCGGSNSAKIEIMSPQSVTECLPESRHTPGNHQLLPPHSVTV